MRISIVLQKLQCYRLQIIGDDDESNSKADKIDRVFRDRVFCETVFRTDYSMYDPISCDRLQFNLSQSFTHRNNKCKVEVQMISVSRRKI